MNLQKIGDEIKARLIPLHKTQTDLFRALNENGYNLSNVQQLYQYTNGNVSSMSNKAQDVLYASLKIINIWEEQKNK